MIGIFEWFLNFVILFLGIILVLFVLIQRGKGGGLVGALGGQGGSSPFGSRAGDKFTRYTIYLAVVWILLNMLQTAMLQRTVERPPATEVRQEPQDG